VVVVILKLFRVEHGDELSVRSIQIRRTTGLTSLPASPIPEPSDPPACPANISPSAKIPVKLHLSILLTRAQIRLTTDLPISS
jgi:hypothetical protein